MPYPKLSPELPHDHALVAAREDFAILDGGRRVFLDNAVTTQKSRDVIRRIKHFYARQNFHAESAAVYAASRKTVARFIGAETREIVFLRGATDAIALVADTWGRDNIGRGDEIVVSALEHQANLTPWRKLAASSGATLRVVPADSDGDLCIEAFQEHLNAHTKLVAVTHVSNVLGTVAPIKAIAAAAHGVGARVLVDGAQAVAHFPVDVNELGVGFYAFSAHKVFGPTGVGALFVKHDVMESADLETGTPDIAGAAGFASALKMLRRLTLIEIARHERKLLDHLSDRLRRVPNLRLIGTTKNKVAIQSFVIDGIPPHVIKSALDLRNVEVQAGQFSALPVLSAFGLDAAVRVSLAFYNTRQDVDTFLDALESITP